MPRRTVADVLDRVADRRRETRCPACRGLVSIRGLDGEYGWSCLDCEAIGFGFDTRAAVVDGLRRAE
ncbi:hypothetical protein [Halovivax limisalsi]|uniref:hypothetical protein n=1 Tax=Halovivax limisalsi TaxID=1453760 RepID=UPI001FFCA865|nr:hypothetical protein [Halovivax limisalsi]